MSFHTIPNARSSDKELVGPVSIFSLYILGDN